MSNFQRKLNLEAMSGANLASAPWLTDMLQHWYPAGHPAPMVQWDGLPRSKKVSGPRPMGLRLAIRNGDMNFYCGGQSVAKVTFGRSLEAETNAKYLTDDEVEGQFYHKLGTEHPNTASLMVRTHGYQGVEKMFVDAVCSANGTVIDMEMALPSMSVASAQKKVAPRVDLVALEPEGGGWKVVFWEAKVHPRNKKGTRIDIPKVIAQLGNYAKWFDNNNAITDVLAAYRENCALLVGLYKRAADLGIKVMPLHDAIYAIARKPEVLQSVDPQVRLLIDLRQDSPHFRRNHLPTLREQGIFVHCVRSEADLILPFVPSET